MGKTKDELPAEFLEELGQDDSRGARIEMLLLAILKELQKKK